MIMVENNSQQFILLSKESLSFRFNLIQILLTSLFVSRYFSVVADFFVALQSTVLSVVRSHHAKEELFALFHNHALEIRGRSS